MATTRIMKVLPDSELSQQLRSAVASGEPFRVDTGEDVYTVLVSQADHAPEDIFANYDPEAAIAGLRALERALAGVDTEQLLADLAEQREQDSTGGLDSRCPTSSTPMSSSPTASGGPVLWNS